MISQHSRSTTLLIWLVLVTLLGCGGSGGDSATNPVANIAPVADAGPDQTVTLSRPNTSTITLIGSSSDSDGIVVAHQWAQTGGIALDLNDADTPSVTFTVGATAQTYTFTYTVTDDDGAQGSDDVIVTVVVINSVPTADAGPDQSITVSGTDPIPVTLRGKASDSDGTIVAHRWAQTGGATVTLGGASTSTATFTAPVTTGAYTFSYMVTDNDGDQATDTVSVYVTRTVFSDSFPNANNWVPSGGVWEVVSGQLRQNDYMVGLSGTTSYQLGAFASLNQPIPANYRFSVDIRPLFNLAPDDDTDGNDVGIMFGYEDLNNYFRVAMNAKFGYTRFEKRRGGTFETLAVNAIGYVEDQPMNMTVEVNGEAIIVWIDGDPVFAVVDPDIPAGTVALYCQDRTQFDNVRITEPPLQPLVVIAAPLAYSVALTQDDYDTLAVEAITLNQPDGSSVEFGLLALNDGSETIEPGIEMIGVYRAEFTGLVAGEHEVLAVLKDADGREVSNDINSTVGVGGDYYVTVGDSITNGLFDEFPWDSADGRIVAIQGFQAQLADLLTGTTGRPQIVFNEGIPGDRALNLAVRIDSILERHPAANRVLLMIGTNDSNNGVSPDQFEFSVRETIGKMNGRQVWLARTIPTFINNSPPPWTLDDTRNSVIQQYNDKMSAIVTAVPDTFLGPDFYTVFFNKVSLYADYLHPNDAGYTVMAEQWHDVLIP